MQKIQSKPLSSIWLKASVLGSIWASVEIILGSFLHNLKVPLSGMILSFISVYLLISFLQVWKENGLIWRAGLICALLKSVSPSALILGPMIGIMTEALLTELFIFVLGKNLAGYLTGGAFAVMATLFHKLISLLILYGLDFIKILSDLYLFAVKQIKLEHVSPAVLVVLITAIYIITGMSGALAGYLTGRNYLKVRSQSFSSDSPVLNPLNKFGGQVAGQSYSLLYLLINLFAIAAVMLLMNSGYLIAPAAMSVLYIGFCIVKYKNSLKRLRKISFWLSFLIITFAAAFLWNGFAHGAFFSTDGLIIGLKMNARAILLIIGFASLSVELRNPVIKSVLYHRGFASLYQSVSLAFSALPFFISNLSKQRNNKKKSFRISFSGILNQAETLLFLFEKESLMKPAIVIITGEIHQGKTTFAREVISGLLKNDIKIAGFLSIGVDVDGERTGFNLRGIESSDQIELCSEVKDEKRIRLGKYYFNPEAISEGTKILSPQKLADKQLVVIDEIGPLELRGGGWSKAIENITIDVRIPQLWIVRKSLSQEIASRWNTGDIYIFDIGDSTVNEVLDKIYEILKTKNQI